MTATNDTLTSRTDDAMAQIARLREQVETLMRETVTPAIDDLAARMDLSAHEASAALRGKAAAVSGVVRAQPLTAILIVAAAGFILGRASR